MSNYYPAGVTGMEPQIAGYDQVENEHVCPGCEWEGAMVGTWLNRYVVEFTCPRCEHDFEVDTSWDD